MKEYVSLEEEVRCDYFITREQKKIWNIEIDLLLKFMDVCNKNNLKYFVAHGTLLGAVRHGGFIPWDDDIDVNMPREDYEKLKEIADREFKEPFFFQTFDSDKECFNGIGKLRTSIATGMDLQDIGRNCNNGLYIDIFPMDGIIEDEKLRHKQSSKVEFYRGLLMAKIYGSNHNYLLQFDKRKWNTYKFLSRFCSMEFLNKKFDAWCRKYTNKDSIREGVISFITDYECCYWYKEDYNELVYLDFEGIKVPAPKNYDRCLKIKWNNYMEYPPIEKRGYKHNDVILDPDIPYNEYDESKFRIDMKNDTKEIILFGAGNIAIEFIKQYRSKVHFAFIVDNDPKKWGKRLLNVEIKSPDIIKKEGILEKRKLIVTSMFYKDIEKQLKEVGLEKYSIYLPGRKY